MLASPVQFSYSSVETRQLWGVGDLSDSAGDLEGVCFVLPGPCFLRRDAKHFWSYEGRSTGAGWLIGPVGSHD